MGKQVLSAHRSITFSAAGLPVAATALRRKSITFSFGNATTGHITLGNSQLASETDAAGIIALSIVGTSLVTLTYETHGECVRQAWWGFANGSQQLFVLEAYEDIE